MAESKTSKNDVKSKSVPQEKLDKPKEFDKEIGGRKGPEPTRYGDWEKNGIISDF